MGPMKATQDRAIVRNDKGELFGTLGVYLSHLTSHQAEARAALEVIKHA